MLWLGAVSLCVWVYLFFFHGGFWRLKVDRAPEPSEFPPIAVVVPARDEAGLVGRAIAALLRQDYPGRLHVFLVDDHSQDATAAEALAAARQAGRAQDLTVVAGAALPAGWTGKLWALAQGLRKARETDPRYVLLTDADIEHSPELLRELVARIESGRLDMASLMVKLRCDSLAERALIPAFIFFFLKLYPPAWIRRRGPIAGAAGGCILVRQSALDRIGGVASIRGALIDDCALARAVKRSGGKVWLGLTRRSWSLRPYRSWTSVRQMIARTAFTQLHHSWILLALTVGALVVTYVAPVVLALEGHGPARLLGLAAWVLMVLAYLPAVEFYELSPLWAAGLPLVALFYLAATLDSAVQYLRGRGGAWKGRAQAKG